MFAVHSDNNYYVYIEIHTLSDIAGYNYKHLHLVRGNVVVVYIEVYNRRDEGRSSEYLHLFINLLQHLHIGPPCMCP